MPVYALLSLPPRQEVLLDANVLVYALTGQSRQCWDLIRRSAAQDVAAFTTVEVLNDVCHRLMLGEAAGRGLIPKQNASALKASAFACCAPLCPQLRRLR